MKVSLRSLRYLEFEKDKRGWFTPLVFETTTKKADHCRRATISIHQTLLLSSRLEMRHNNKKVLLLLPRFGLLLGYIQGESPSSRSLVYVCTQLVLAFVLDPST